MNAQQQREALENALISFGLTNLTTIQNIVVFLFSAMRKIIFFAWFRFALNPGKFIFSVRISAHLAKN